MTTPPLTPLERTIFSVSQLNRRAKQLLETHLPLIWVSGEISNFAQPTSGHWYFSLKDERAQVRCAMFKNANMRLRWRPESGKQVLIRARVSLYEGRGEYQLIAEHMEDAGAGALQQAYEALKQKLDSEGLFDPALKKELPLFPQHIGVITSPTGAAIHDILNVLSRRYPIASVTIIPVAVQGETAAKELVRALKKAEQFGQFDVLIIGRGGGSIEDLWAFNDEQLARTIAACPIPIISAVGHEVDFTICDFVADLRAPTPSASAELATPELEEWQLTLDARLSQLVRRQRSVLQEKRKQLVHLLKRLRHPKEKIQFQQQQLQKLTQQLQRAILNQIKNTNLLLQQYQQRCLQQHPNKIIQQKQRALGDTQTRLKRAIHQHFYQQKQTLANQASLLNAVNPLAILARGYSVTKNEKGHILKSTKQIQTGAIVRVQLAEGQFSGEVRDIDN